MLFGTFKYYQSNFQLELNDKFACAKLALKDFTVLSPIIITTDLITLPASQRAYVFTFILQ